MKTKLTYFPLGAVEVTDGYCKNALDREIDYLLSIQEGRLLAGFYENAGIPSPYVRYGGWESKLIGGHTLGHYLTAVSQGYANTGVEKAARDKLLLKAKNIIDGLRECQEKSGGFLWGAPKTAGGAEAQFDCVERGKTNIVKEAWVPWYTMHKLLAGLVDCYCLTGYPLARTVASELGDWVYRRVSRWDEGLKERVLAVEYGGMNDCLYQLFALTGKQEHAAAAHAFDEEPLFDLILSGRENALNNRHANTTIPKILGALSRYLVLGEGEERYLRVAEVFFCMVTERHTYVTGGNSEWEHFGRDYVLDRERTNCNCETCNAYNMLKLARLLFCVTGDKRYTDYYENTFTNSILSSQNPETGMTTYFQPMAGGFFKVYSTPYDKFWCCTGSGMESFTKLGDSAYYTDGTDLYVEQYLASRLNTEDLEIEQKSNFPLDGTAQFYVKRAAQVFFLHFRIPDWAAGDIAIEKNGVFVEAERLEGHLVARAEAGDVFAVTVPIGVTLHGLPDGKDVYAFRYGGAVLSADLGTQKMEETTTGVDVTIPAKKVLVSERVYFPDVADVLKNSSDYMVRDGDAFHLTGGDMPLTFGLHYRRYRERYAIYFYLKEGEREAEAETRTPYDSVQPGYGQYENDELHEMSERDSVSVTLENTCRFARAGGYFKYDLSVNPLKCNYLSVELLKADNQKPLRICIGDEELFDEILCYTQGEESYRREFLIPSELIKEFGRKKRANGKEFTVIPVSFRGFSGRDSARVCETVDIYCE